MNKTVKTIIIAAAILGAMAIAYAVGASGRASMVKQADIPVGMLVTTQPLPVADDDRLYAEYIDGEYVFNGVDGMQCFFTNKDNMDNAIVSHVDAAFTDKSSKLHVIDDDRQNVELRAKLYLGTSFDEILYQNPVYQTASGEVYAVAGQGAQYNGEGMKGSFSRSESVRRYEDGKMMSYGTSVNIDVEVIAVPEKIAVSQFDAEGKLISSESFMPGEMPDSMNSSAAYIVVGTVSQSGTKYEVFQPDDNSISALYCRADGVCVKQSCAVSWEGK